MHPKKAFNLLDEPWIPVLDHAGSPSRVTLKDVFSQAPKLREVRAESPLVTVSLHRLLLAILYRACPPKSINDWGDLWDDGLPMAAIVSYLESHHDGFYLVHPERPWLQCANLTEDPEASFGTINNLFPEKASGNNRQISDHSLDKEPDSIPLCLAAQYLTASRHWLTGGTAGGGRPNYHAGTLVGSSHILVLGEDLSSTLIHNLVPATLLKSEPHNIKVSPPEHPFELTGLWEAHDFVGSSLMPSVAEWLLLPSRYILLSDFAGVSEESMEVRSVRMKPGAKPQLTSFIDPWTSVRRSDLGYHKIPIRKDHALWRNFPSLFNTFSSDGQDGSIAAAPVRTINVAQTRGRGPDQLQFRQLVCGMANDQAKIILWREAEFRLPAKFYSEHSGPSLFKSSSTAIQIAQRCYNALGDVLREFASTALSSDSMKADREGVNKLRDRLMRQHDFWGSLEADFHQFLQDVSDSKDGAAERSWEQAVRRNVKSSFDAAVGVYPIASARILQARVTAEEKFNHRINAIIPKEPLSHATEASNG